MGVCTGCSAEVADDQLVEGLCPNCRTAQKDKEAAAPAGGEEAAAPAGGEEAATPEGGEEAAAPAGGEEAATPEGGEGEAPAA